MGQEPNTSQQTSEKSKLKELSMSEKLLCLRISKGKSQSVDIVAHLKNKSQGAQNTAHLDNPICKVTMAETNMSHEHLAKRSTHAPRVKPDAIHLHLNKSM